MANLSVLIVFALCLATATGTSVGNAVSGSIEVGEYFDINAPTTYRWELSNKYPQVTLNWNTGEFVKGHTTSRDASPECILEHEVDCPPGNGKSLWHCYKCTAIKAVPAGFSCHMKFFRNINLVDATCQLMNHYTPGNSTLIDTGLYPRTFSTARRKCTTLAINNTPLPPHRDTKCAIHVDIYHGRMLSSSGSCTDDSCAAIQCGKSSKKGKCCDNAGCSGDGNGKCTCNKPKCDATYPKCDGDCGPPEGTVVYVCEKDKKTCRCAYTPPGDK